MKIEDFNKLEQYKKAQDTLITGHSLENKQDRTLLYGYTCDRDTWHVYLKKGNIHTVIYRNNLCRNFPIGLKEVLVKTNQDYIPNKRLYPAACDYEFCKLLKDMDCHLPFTSYDDREQDVFYGYTIEDSNVDCIDCVNGDNIQNCNTCEEYSLYQRKDEE